MTSRDKRLHTVHPDEWGFYNPEQAGLRAVLERIEARYRSLRRSDDSSSTRPPAEPTASRRPLKKARSR